MSPTLEPIHRLAARLRAHGPALLGNASAPHDELMSLVWGPRFDRAHALGLLAQRPHAPAESVQALLATADDFDRLHVQAQRRLRQLIVRHRAWCAARSAM